MTWTTAFLVLTPTILLFVQGTSCLMRRQRHRSVPIFGLLSILLSVIGLLLYLLLVTDSIVLSPEFGLVMVQGPLAWFGMVLLLMGIAVSGGMGLLVCRLRTRPEVDRLWYLVLVFAVLLAGISAVSRLSPLNLDDSKLFRIYAYDVWWPSLLIWLSLCLSESVSTILRLQHWTARLWLTTAMTTGLALAALARPTVGDPSTHHLWQVYLRVVLPISASAAVWHLLSPHGRGSARPELRLRHMLILLPAVIALFNLLLWLAIWKPWLDIRQPTGSGR